MARLAVASAALALLARLVSAQEEAKGRDDTCNIIQASAPIRTEQALSPALPSESANLAKAISGKASIYQRWIIAAELQEWERRKIGTVNASYHQES